MKPYLKSIYIYPIKSLDGVALTQATILDGGALKHDREFALLEQNGHFVNGKRYPQIHKIRSTFTPDFKTVSLNIQGNDNQVTFDLEHDKNELESWFSDYFCFKIKLIQNKLTGFPDDTNAVGPTVISTATIKVIASWFNGITVEEIRRRMRANLEIDGVPPFWEDQLFGQEGEKIQFKIGDVLLEGINPCQRCVVPTRDSYTGIITAKFRETFVKKRQETLPNWTTASRFNHYYRASVNTNIPDSERGKLLRQGDKIIIVKKR